MKTALAAAAMLVLLAWPPQAGAAEEEITRASYRAKAEPICKRNTAANRRILRGARAKVNRGKLRPAGRQFSRAAKALRAALAQIGALPRPPADAARLTRWLSRVGRQAKLLAQIGKALGQGRRRRAEVLSVKLTSGARLTNAIVAPMGFNHCRLEPSKFT